MRWMRRLDLTTLLYGNIIVAIMLAGALLSNELLIEHRVAAQQYVDSSEVPCNRVGLVLGTLPVARDGSPNPFFRDRMLAAAELYCSGKVQRLLLSGAENSWGYDEPEEMRQALLGLGVPAEAMILDRAGINTFTSIVRTKEVFGYERFTIVSQAYHNVRALFIAEELGAEAIGFNAKDQPPIRAKRSWLRERGSRVKMWLDLIG
ncbi:MAG: SanA/YdcF family protein [Flavobacteriales bacterium]